MACSRFGVCMMLAAMVLFVSPAMARKGTKSGSAQNKNSVATPGNSMASDPNAGLNGGGGNDELGKDAAAMDLAEKKVDATFEASPDWTKAEDAFHNAQDEYGLAKKAAIATLKTNADYLAAKDAADKAETDLETLRNNPASSGDDISAAATASFAAKSKVSLIEKDACTIDPGVASAKAAVVQATSTLSTLRGQEHDAVLADADYQAAKSKYDAAKTATKSTPTS